MALNEYELGNYSQSLELFNLLIKTDSNNYQAYQMRGVIYKSQNNLMKAHENFSQAIKLNPNDYISYNNRGLVFKEQKNFRKAIEDYKKSIELNPRFSDAYNNLASIYSIQEKYEEAFLIFKEAIEFNPEDQILKANFEKCKLESALIVKIPKLEQENNFYGFKTTNSFQNNCFQNETRKEDREKEKEKETLWDQSKIITLNLEGVKYFQEGNFWCSLYFFKQSLCYAKKQSSNEIEIYSIHYNLGSVYLNLFKYEKAKKHFFKILNENKELSNEKRRKIKIKITTCEELEKSEENKNIQCVYVPQGKMAHFSFNKNTGINGLFTEQFYDYNIIVFINKERTKCSLLNVDHIFQIKKEISKEINWIGSESTNYFITKDNYEATELYSEIVTKSGIKFEVILTNEYGTSGVGVINGKIQTFTNPLFYPHLLHHPLSKKIKVITSANSACDIITRDYQPMERFIYNDNVWTKPSSYEIKLTEKNQKIYNCLQPLSKIESNQFQIDSILQYHKDMIQLEIFHVLPLTEKDLEREFRKNKRKMNSLTNNKQLVFLENLYNVLINYSSSFKNGTLENKHYLKLMFIAGNKNKNPYGSLVTFLSNIKKINNKQFQKNFNDLKRSLNKIIEEYKNNINLNRTSNKTTFGNKRNNKNKKKNIKNNNSNSKKNKNNNHNKNKNSNKNKNYNKNKNRKNKNNKNSNNKEIRNINKSKKDQIQKNGCNIEDKNFKNNSFSKTHKIFINTTIDGIVRYDLNYESKNNKIFGLGAHCIKNTLVIIVYNQNNDENQKISLIHKGKQLDWENIINEINWFNSENLGLYLVYNKNNENIKTKKILNDAILNLINYKIQIFPIETESICITKNKKIFEPNVKNFKNEHYIFLIDPFYHYNKYVNEINYIINNPNKRIQKNKEFFLQFNEMKWTLNQKKISIDSQTIIDYLKINNKSTINAIEKKLKNLIQTSVNENDKLYFFQVIKRDQNNQQKIKDLSQLIFNYQQNNFPNENFIFLENQSIQLLNLVFPIFLGKQNNNYIVNAWSNIINFETDNKLITWLKENTKIKNKQEKLEKNINKKFPNFQINNLIFENINISSQKLNDNSNNILVLRTLFQEGFIFDNHDNRFNINKKIMEGESKINTVKDEHKKIWFSEKPPLLGGQPKKITIKELEKLIGNNFIFSEKPKFNKRVLKLAQNLIKKLPKPTAPLKKQLELHLKKPNLDNLIICKINNNVGYGVFARKDIKAGTLINLYSGQLVRKTKRITDYSMDIDTITGYSDFSFDAINYGGVSRFFQDLPNNLDQEVDDFSKIFKTNEKRLIRNQLFFYGVHTINEQNKIIKRLSNKKFIKKEYKKFIQSKNYYQFSYFFFDINHSQSLSKNQIACSNLLAKTVNMDNKPYFCFVSSRNIKKNEQIGFPYGLGYWLSKKRIPELFYTNGQVIPKSLYKFKKLPVSVDLPSISKFKKGKLSRILFYEKSTYEIDHKTKFPIQFAKIDHPVSFFRVKKWLVKYNVLPKRHGKLDINNLSIVQTFKNFFPNFVKIEVYYSNPFIENSDFDIVFRTKNIRDWGKINVFFRTHLPEICKCFQYSYEILVNKIIFNQEQLNMVSFLIHFGGEQLKKQFFSRNGIKIHLPIEPKENEFVIKKDGRYGIIPISIAKKYL
ncbi:tetratricopeptide repeat protein [Anaeramoeba flamelloides]|uniref:Tetratricopeptide repeat protein n=1 Tax=Anaeramoeba flamelloides TaxID=1746091 RepID=A0AAV7ZYC4_9EUKA|nr:tetratricopeptide repeat protein [Anaeramoeba flamelloides]